MSWGTGRIPWREPEGSKNQSKSPPLSVTIGKQFQAVVRSLTRRMPVPKPGARRKQSGDTDGALALAVTHFIRRAFVTVAAQTARRVFLQAPLGRAVTDFMWDAFAWLHLWEPNNGAGFHGGCRHSDTYEQNELSLHL